MRCPMCDAKSTHIQTERAEHTRLHRYKCNLCGLNFNAYEIYTSQGLKPSEEKAMTQAKIMQCVFAREEKK